MDLARLSVDARLEYAGSGAGLRDGLADPGDDEISAPDW